MTEQSIREDLIAVIDKAEEDHFQSVKQWVSDRCPNPVPGHHREPVADAILASPVIRRIQAEARAEGFREGVNFIDNDPSLSWGGSMVAGRSEAARRMASIENVTDD